MYTSREAAVLVAIADILTAQQDLTEALRLVCRELARFTGAETVSVYLVDEPRHELVPTAAYHVPKDALDVLMRERVPIGEEALGRTVFGAGEVVCSDDVPDDPRFDLPLFKRYPHRSSVIVPVLVGSGVAGVFYLVWWHHRRRFQTLETAVLHAVGHQVGLLLANARLFREVERQRAEAQLAEEHYRSLVEQVPVGLFRTTPEGEILDANPAIVAILGYESFEALRVMRTPELYRDSGERERFVALLERDGVVTNFDVTLRRRDGTDVPVRLNTRLVYRDGARQFEGVVQDISDLRRAEQAERKAETLRYVATLANAAAHEINNPLSVITGRLELLLRAAGGDETAARKLKQTLEAARRIANIVARMGRISRLEMREDVKESPMLDLRRSGEADSDSDQ